MTSSILTFLLYYEIKTRNDSRWTELKRDFLYIVILIFNLHIKFFFRLKKSLHVDVYKSYMARKYWTCLYLLFLYIFFYKMKNLYAKRIYKRYWMKFAYILLNFYITWTKNTREKKKKIWSVVFCWLKLSYINSNCF